MNDAVRNEQISFIVRSCCDEMINSYELLRDALTSYLEEYDNDTLAAVTMIAVYRVPHHEKLAKNDLIISMILCDETLAIRTFANHLDEIRDCDLSIESASLLLSALRALGLIDAEDDYYPHLKSHAALARYSANSRIPYHRKAELVRLVHEYPDKHEEIVNLIHVTGVTDVGLVRERLLNAAPALAEGIL